MTPMCWHGLPVELYEELIHSFQLSAVVLATTMDELGCIAGIRMKVPVVACCFTQDHIDALRQRVEDVVWCEMQDEASDLYEAGLVKALGPKSAKSA
eukprot:2485244-Amphidinium_carterae.1